MKRIIAVLIALVLLPACTALADDSILVVSGNGSAAMDADWVSATVGVEFSGVDLTSLQQKVNDVMASISSALLNAGLDEKNIATNNFYVSPVYDYSASSVLFRGADESSELIKGYTITNSLSIQTDELDRIGTYIDAAFAAGANSFNSVNFFTQDDSAARQLALEHAVADARSKAEIIAAASGKQLGGILEIQEGGVNSGYTRSNAAKAWAYDAVPEMAAGTTIAASQVVVSADILITYELK